MGWSLRTIVLCRVVGVEFGYGMSRDDTKASLKQLFRHSHRTATSTLFPSLLVTIPPSELVESRQPGTTMADLAIRHFMRLGLRCDRTRQNLYGYPGIFRDLMEPPPFATVTCEDIDEPWSLEQEEDLVPLYIQANEKDSQNLLEAYRHELDTRNEALAKAGFVSQILPTSEILVDLLREKIELARCLGTKQFEAIIDCILEPFNEVYTVSGAPDLLVWSETEDLWFFAEVKGPNDSLRASQANWIRSNWQTIQGRFLLVIIHEDQENDA